MSDALLKSAFGAMKESIMAESPEIAAIFNNPDLSESDMMQQLMGVLQKNPELEEKIIGASFRALAPLRQTGLETMPPAIIMDSPHGGLPRLNPLYEAAIVERVQFDGDIPELRTGPLLEETMPAVSVETQARSPVAIGEMLRIASEDVKEEVVTHQRRLGAAIAEKKMDVLDVAAKHGELVAQQGERDMALELAGSAETDLAIYRRGEVPKPIKVETPNGTVMASMTEGERRTHAWKFLSTTQGRRTAVTVVRGLIQEHLAGAGFKVGVQEFKPETPSEVIAARKWSVNLGGPGSTQPSFSFIDVASRVLAKGLLEDLKGKDIPGNLSLEVTSIDQLTARVVGWAARLV